MDKSVSAKSVWVAKATYQGFVGRDGGRFSVSLTSHTSHINLATFHELRDPIVPLVAAKLS